MMDKKAKRIVLSDYNVRRYLILVVILAAMLVGFSFVSNRYATLANFSNVALQYAEIGMIAISMTLVIITGNIDLSVGSVLCFSAFTTGIFMQQNVPVPLAVAFSLAIGFGIGALNGLFVSKFKMQAVIVTLGTMTAFRGLSYALTNGMAIRGFPDESFFDFGQATVFGFLPASFLLMIILYVVMYMAMKHTKLGMNLIAIGNNETAAIFSGVRVDLCKFLIFAFNGLISALAGICMLSRLMGLEASVGKGYEFDAITICLLGGINIKGGQGTLLGTFLGLIVVAYLKNGMNLARIDPIYQSAILGIVIMVAVVTADLRRPGKKVAAEAN